MSTQDFSELLLYFMLYSIAGWICETTWCSVAGKRFINRGFLSGPYCPIYGAGAIVILLVTGPVSQSPVLVFLLSLFAASILEYFTGWLLETLFQIQWWDYSNRKFQMKGRVCLGNAALFGVMGCITVYLLHPLSTSLVERISESRIISNILISILLLDLLITLNNLLGFTSKLQQLQAELQKLRRNDWYDAKDLKGSIERLRAVALGDKTNMAAADILKRLEAVAEKAQRIPRFFRSYPDLRVNNLEEALEAVRENLLRRKESIQESAEQYKEALQEKALQYKEALQERTLKRKEALHKRILEGAKRAGRETVSSIASHLNYHDLFWVFVIASVLGYIVETLYCLATRGAIESRQGLLYGPFSQVYGFGAVLMVLFLTPLTKRSDRWLFIGGALLGGAFEVICSLAQEYVLGSVSWDYSNTSVPIAGGRTNLMYMLFWGILGLMFMKGIYPRLSRLITRLSKYQRMNLTSIVTVILCIDMLLSGTAVYRWTERNKGIEPNNAYEEFLDAQYPDGVMQEIYPNMTMLE